MIKKPESWLRFCFALVLFWAILCFSDLLMGDLATFNANINNEVVAQGYLSALRGLVLFFIISAALVMATLLRRGFVLAPLIWLLQGGRIAYSLSWQDMVSNLLFVAPVLNLFIFIVLPILLALLFWQALERIDPQVNFGPFLPSLWLLLAICGAAGSLFTWHWSLSLSLDLWPGGYGAITAITGAIFLVLTADRHPWTGLVLFFGGLLLPSIACVAIWGVYDGLSLAFLSLLPWSGGDAVVWLGLMALTGGPLLLVTAVNQFFAWRRGSKLIEII